MKMLRDARAGWILLAVLTFLLILSGFPAADPLSGKIALAQGGPESAATRSLGPRKELTPNGKRLPRRSCNCRENSK